MMESSSDSMRFAGSISQQMGGELFFRVQTFSELEEVFRSTDVTVNFRCLIAGKMLKTSPNESIMNFLMDSSIPKFIRQAVVKRIQPGPLTKAYEEKLHEYSQKRPYSPKELESLRLVTSCFEVPLLQLTDLASKQYCDEVISGLAKSCKISSYAEFYQAATCIHRPEKVIQQLAQHVPSITLDEFNEFRRWEEKNKKGHEKLAASAHLAHKLPELDASTFLDLYDSIACEMYNFHLGMRIGSVNEEEAMCVLSTLKLSGSNGMQFSQHLMSLLSPLTVSELSDMIVKHKNIPSAFILRVQGATYQEYVDFCARHPESKELHGILLSRVSSGYDHMQEDMQKDDQLFWSYISSVRTSGTYFFLARDDDIKGSEYQPNPLYRDAYLSELGRAHADSLYLGAQKIVHDTMARLRLTPADEQRKKLNQKHINTQQFDFLRALGYEVELQESGRGIVLYERYAQGCCPLASYVIKEALKIYVGEYSEVFDHIVEVPRHQYSTVSYDTMVDPDVTALPLVSGKDFEKETHVYRNLLHMTDGSPDPSKGSRQITSMAINCNDKRAGLEHVGVQADIFFSGGENEYLEHDPNVPWKDPKKNKAHSLAGLIQEVIRSMQELEELMRSDVFGPTKKKPVFQEVLDRLLCILYDRV